MECRGPESSLASRSVGESVSADERGHLTAADARESLRSSVRLLAQRRVFLFNYLGPHGRGIPRTLIQRPRSLRTEA